MLEYLDWILIAVYFIVVFLVAFWSSFSKKRQSRDSSDYFLAGRNVGWFIIGASLFASNIGSYHLVFLGCSVA
jgi:SSS family solute:Na+ symporter